MEGKFSRNHLTVLLKQVNFMVCKLHPNKAVKKNKRSGRKGNCFKNSYLDIQHCWLHPKADFTVPPPAAVSSCPTTKEMQT